MSTSMETAFSKKFNSCLAGKEPAISYRTWRLTRIFKLFYNWLLYSANLASSTFLQPIHLRLILLSSSIYINLLLIQNNFVCPPNDASHTSPHSTHLAQTVSTYAATPFDHIKFLASADDARGRRKWSTPPPPRYPSAILGTHPPADQPGL